MHSTASRYISTLCTSICSPPLGEWEGAASKSRSFYESRWLYTVQPISPCSLLTSVALFKALYRYYFSFYVVRNYNIFTPGYRNYTAACIHLIARSPCGSINGTSVRLASIAVSLCLIITRLDSFGCVFGYCFGCVRLRSAAPRQCESVSYCYLTRRTQKSYSKWS